MATKSKGLYYAAAATTAIAGILHLSGAANSFGFSVNIGIFFTVAGIAQLFWVVPMVKRWGKPWYYTGIGGTAVLIAIFVITRVQGNPITGRGLPVNTMGIAVELFEAAFIGLTAAVIAYESKRIQLDIKTAGRKNAADAA
jgi:hypothetical protein